MFIKVTSSGPRRYVQLVEAYRDDNGQPKQRTVATLGRLDRLGSELESVIAGLLKLTGRSLDDVAEPPPPVLAFEPARAMGDVWVLSELWNELGFDDLRRIFARTRHEIDIEALLRIMVLNRLSDPESKLGVLRWLETTSLPGIVPEVVAHHHLLRAMDALIEYQDEVDGVLAGLLRPLVDQELSVVFYDMTTIRAEGLSQQDGDVRQFGMAKEETLGEETWNGLRLIIAHNPHTAAEMGAHRDQVIAKLEQQATEWSGKLDAQDGGKRSRGRKLSDGGARSRFYHAVCEAHLARIIRVDLKSELFSYAIDERALAHARLMDGKLLLVTNTTDLMPAQVVEHYKSLADIERGFRVLKSEIEIGPVYHRLPERIRSHATICFMALILYRVMRQRLHASPTGLSPERALSKLRSIQHHQVTLNDSQPITGISSISQEQSRVLSALGVKKPASNEQLTLL